jgi:hypothetical protein
VVLPGAPCAVSVLRFSPGAGTLLASCGPSSTGADGDCEETRGAEIGSSEHVVAGGVCVIVCRVHDVDAAPLVFQTQSAFGTCTSLDWSLDGRWIQVSTNKGEMLYWNCETLRAVTPDVPEEWNALVELHDIPAATLGRVLHDTDRALDSSGLTLGWNSWTAAVGLGVAGAVWKKGAGDRNGEGWEGNAVVTCRSGDSRVLLVRAL